MWWFIGTAALVVFVAVYLIFFRTRLILNSGTFDNNPKGIVGKVWVEPGCIVCDLCEDLCPDVFRMTTMDVLITPEGRDHPELYSRGIINSAIGCPVKVIKYELKKPKQTEHFYCPECKYRHALADEDHCCHTCGADCVIEKCDCSMG